MSNKTIYFQKKPLFFSIVFFLLGLFQTISTSLRIASGNYGNSEIIFLALSILIMALAIMMHPKLRFIPRIELNSDEIRIKPEIYSKATSINWNLITKVKFSSYQITFFLKDHSSEIFALPKLKDISLDAKKAINDICTTKDIEIERV